MQESTPAHGARESACLLGWGQYAEETRQTARQKARHHMSLRAKPNRYCSEPISIRTIDGGCLVPIGHIDPRVPVSHRDARATQFIVTPQEDRCEKHVCGTNPSLPFRLANLRREPIGRLHVKHDLNIRTRVTAISYYSAN